MSSGSQEIQPTEFSCSFIRHWLQWLSSIKLRLVGHSTSYETLVNPGLKKFYLIRPLIIECSIKHLSQHFQPTLHVIDPLAEQQILCRFVCRSLGSILVQTARDHRSSSGRATTFEQTVRSLPKRTTLGDASRAVPLLLPFYHPLPARSRPID